VLGETEYQRKWQASWAEQRLAADERRNIRRIGSGEALAAEAHR